MTSALRILGIDPGSLVAGFGCLEATKPKPLMPSDFRVADAGVIRIQKSLDLAERIGYLHDSLHQLICDLHPHIVVVERAFYGINANTTIRLGEARGAVIAAARRHSLKVCEITPAEVKKTITGNGRAGKDLVQQSVQTLLRFKSLNTPFDASDALAIALCYGMTMAHADLVARAGAGRMDSSDVG